MGIRGLFKCLVGAEPETFDGEPSEDIPRAAPFKIQVRPPVSRSTSQALASVDNIDGCRCVRAKLQVLGSMVLCVIGA